MIWKKQMNRKYPLKKIEKSDVGNRTLIDHLKAMEGKEFIITVNFGQEGKCGKKRK